MIFHTKTFFSCLGSFGMQECVLDTSSHEHQDFQEGKVTAFLQLLIHRSCPKIRLSNTFKLSEYDYLKSFQLDWKDVIGFFDERRGPGIATFQNSISESSLPATKLWEASGGFRIIWGKKGDFAEVCCPALPSTQCYLTSKNSL